MYFLAVNLYEFGQFLQILLWISLPMVLIALLVTTYLHYRKKRRQKDEEGPPSEYAPAGDRLANGLLVGEPSAALPEESGNAYRGLLWMKDKYEQYREQTDRKYEKLKEELARSEQKYLELLSLRNSPEPVGTTPDLIKLPDSAATEIVPPSAETSIPVNRAPGAASAVQGNIAPPLPPEKDRQISFLQNQLDQRIKNYHQLEQLARRDRARAEEANSLYLQAQQELQELQSKIEILNQRVAQETGKVTDLTGKLENNVRLLLHIHQELDRSLGKRLPGNEQQPIDKASQSSVNKINAEVEEVADIGAVSGEKEEAPRENSRSPLAEDTKIVAWVECEEVPEGARQTG